MIKQTLGTFFGICLFIVFLVAIFIFLMEPLITATQTTANPPRPGSEDRVFGDFGEEE